MEQDEVARRGERDGPARAALAAEDDLLTQQHDRRRVRRKREHNEIGVEAVDAVPTGTLASRSNMLCDFVLALSRAVRARKDHAQAAPQRVVLDLVADKVAKVYRDSRHELGARSDAIRVEAVVAAAVIRSSCDVLHGGCGRQICCVGFSGGRCHSSRSLGNSICGSHCGSLLGGGCRLLCRFRLEQRAVARDTIAPLPLLIHLGARCDAIDGNVQQPLWTHELHKGVEVVAHADELVSLGTAKRFAGVAVRRWRPQSADPFALWSHTF